MNQVVHGGRLDDAVAQFGGAKDKWLDLSTGINPNSWKVPELSNDIWARLPDDALYAACDAAARTAYGVSDQAHISIASGSQMHIQTVPYLFKPQAVAIVGFTYQEHGICWKRAGHEVYVTDGLSSAETTARIVIVVNPNNPDGRIFDREDLISLARRLAAKGGLLVVDEAFADVAPRASVADQAGRDGLLVLRSLGKFYGLGGVRLGFALSTEPVVQKIDERLGPWAVSGPALAVGAAALADAKWSKRALVKLSAIRETMEELLAKNDFEIVGGTGLFVLARRKDCSALVKFLASKQILVRAYPGKPEWLRFGMPPGKGGVTRLQKALDAFKAKSEAKAV